VRDLMSLLKASLEPEMQKATGRKKTTSSKMAAKKKVAGKSKSTRAKRSHAS